MHRYITPYKKNCVCSEDIQQHVQTLWIRLQPNEMTSIGKLMKCLYKLLDARRSMWYSAYLLPKQERGE